MPVNPVAAAPAPAPVRREPIAAVKEPSNQPIEVVDIDLPTTGPQPPRPAPKTGSVPAPKPITPAPPPPAPVRPAPAVSAPVITQTLAPAPAAPAQGESLPGDSAVPASQALYDRGYSLFYQGHFVDAETSFQRFLQANPKSDLADNAQYWIGECRYSRNDVKGALAAFRQVVEKYPKGNKIADAMLKTGQCLEAMGDVEGARVTYREVTRRFSGTAAATAAEERRAKLP
jgi:tol-pal system protein YbgF